MRTHRPASFAFTMVELLLVIGILLSLLAIAFPVYQQAREKSRRTACSSNLHQIYLGISLYRADYDGNYPVAIDNALRNNPENALNPELPKWRTMKTMPEALAPYVTENSVYHCPSDVRPFRTFRPDGTVFLADSRFAGYGESYLFNYQLGNAGRQETDVSPSGYLATDVLFPYHYPPGTDYFYEQGNWLAIDGHIIFKTGSKD